jgi:hypothetical protein
MSSPVASKKDDSRRSCWFGDTRSRGDAEAKGFYFSFLNPELYCQYDRAQYIETLVDWGRFGPPESAPRWYTEEVARFQV